MFSALWYGAAVRRIVLAFTAALLATACATDRQVLTPQTAIVDTTLIDIETGERRPNTTVIIEGERIVSVMPNGMASLGSNTRRIDGSGTFMIPGLWDMHTHVAEYADIWEPVLLAHGITGVRNMHAVSLELTQAIAQQVQDGTRVGPRMVANGQLVDGPGGPWPTGITVATPDEARETVDELADQGADFIKVYSFLSADAYFAIADEAALQGIPFAGHVPQSITPAQACAAGQHSIEHLDGMLLAVARGEDALRQRFVEASALWRAPATAQEGAASMIKVNRDIVDSYDESKAATLFRSCNASDTYHTPTLVTFYTNSHRAEPEILANSALRYVPASLRAQWLSLAPPNPAMVESQRNQFSAYLRLLNAMVEADVPILAGTDTGGTLIVPGDSLHRELDLMVRAGLTPLQALQTATLNPARYLGEESRIGAIRAGYIADLVLLDDDPLIAITNTRSIAGVIKSGSYYSRKQLDELLEQAALAVEEQ